MSDCARIQDLLADALDSPCAAADARAIASHCEFCGACSAVRAELERLEQELPALSCRDEVSSDLGRRLAASVASPKRALADRARTYRFLEIQRVAGWGLVFLGAWWTLAGARIAGLAERELVPRAEAVVASVKARVDESGVPAYVTGAAHRLDQASHDLRNRMIGPPGELLLSDEPAK